MNSSGAGGTRRGVGTAGLPPEAPPRRLGAFEQLMLAEDCPEHPACFFIECAVSGPLDEARFRSSVATAAGRHPLLCSRVGRCGGRPVWLAPDVSPQVLWNPHELPTGTIDLTRESGLRFAVVEVEAATFRVIMQCHHAVCDGIAGCEYLGDVWAIYDGRAPRPFTTQRRIRQAPPRADVRPARATNRGGVAVVANGFRFAMFRPTPLARLPAATAASRAAVAAEVRTPYERIRLRPDEMRQVRAAADAASVSVNAILVAAVMRAAAAWNTAVRGRQGNIRITMPLNIRTTGCRQPACNATSYAFLDRRSVDIQPLLPLASAVTDATDWVFKAGASTRFLEVLEKIVRLPWVLRLVTRLPTCFTTVVVSNVGDPSRRMRTGAARIDGCDTVAGLVIRDVFGVPPIRSRTRVAIGVSTYAGGMTITCICSADPDRARGASRFLASVRRELEHLVGSTAAESLRSSIRHAPERSIP
jgi:hypothetical protein